MGAKPLQLNTSLSEFTYTMARETPNALKRFLPEKLFRSINTEKGAMRFAARSTWEQKREFFAYLGVEMFAIFVDTQGGKVNDFRQIFRDFDVEDSPGETMRKLVEKNIFVTSNKQLCYQLGLMTQTIDTKGYARSMEILRTAYHIKNYKNKISVSEHADAVEEIDHSNVILKFISSVLFVNDHCEDNTGIDTSALRLLLYYFINRNSYIPQEKIKDVFAGSLSGRKIISAKQILTSNGLIQRHARQERHEHTITGKGILTVNQFRDKVIKSMDF